MAASAMTMTTNFPHTNFIDTRQQAPSPPHSREASPIISRKPLPDAPSHTEEMSISASCPSCGHNFTPTGAEEAQRMIEDLQAQVRLLNSKAAAAVDRLADYEDELRTLRAERQERDVNSTTPNNNSTPPPSTTQQQQQQQRNTPQSRLSTLRSYLGGRRNPSDSTIDTSILSSNTAAASAAAAALTSASHPNLPLTNPSSTTPIVTPMAPPPPPLSTASAAAPPEPTLLTLQSTLATERTLRLKAETNLTQTQMELEELTASLFGQANEMVAEERRARSKLEERVRVLERKGKEKGERLRRLEGRVERVERVRGLVG